MRVKYFLIIALLYGSNVLAVNEEVPSMDFLEYLGELETEIDGESVSPIELELIADNAKGEEKDDE